jgi:hypothetical protein
VPQQLVRLLWPAGPDDVSLAAVQACIRDTLGNDDMRSGGNPRMTCVSSSLTPREIKNELELAPSLINTE